VVKNKFNSEMLSLLSKNGFEKLRHSRVLVVGLGGLGSQAATLLAKAGVGVIGLVDFDVVELTNLQRQVYYKTADIGRLKTEVLSAKLNELNHRVKIETYNVKLSSDNVLDIISRYDVVVDGTDNYPARYLLSDACVLKNRLLVYGSMYRFFGQITVFADPNGPCYRCLYPSPPPLGAVPNCADGGVMGPLPGFIGGLQAIETIKILLGVGKPLIGRLLIIDLSKPDFAEMQISRNPGCPVCGDKSSTELLKDYETVCANPQTDLIELSPREVKELFEIGEDVILIDIRERPEREICKIDGSIHIPESKLWENIRELQNYKYVILYCHKGVISNFVVNILRSMGYKNIFSLKGGIEGWAEKIDPTLPVY